MGNTQDPKVLYHAFVKAQRLGRDTKVPEYYLTEVPKIMDIDTPEGSFSFIIAIQA